MANRLVFHYFPGNSFLHRWDTRCKLPALLISTIGLLHMTAESLAIFTVLLGALYISAGLPWGPLFSDLKGWGVLLLLVFLAQAFLAPQTSTPLLASAGSPLIQPNIHLAALTCWRLALIICCAILFTLVTPPRELRNALIWFMGPFPFMPARRIALLATLTIRFIPSLLDQADEIRQAIRLRAGHRRRNPIHRIKVVILPLFRRSLIRADETAMSLAARGYREDIRFHFPKLPLAHSLALILLLVALTASYFEASLLGSG
jgi:biotin transport system permease protein